MDLLELNDIYCKDKARICHDKFFKDPVCVGYHFVPTEESLYSSGGGGMISAVLNNPLGGISSVDVPHDLTIINGMIHDRTPLTDYQQGYNSEHSGDADSMNIRLATYDVSRQFYQNYHLDIAFSDKIPGMTLITDCLKNSNVELLDIKENLKLDDRVVDGIHNDGRSLSMVYVPVTGDKLFAYGTVIYTGRGLVSLGDEMKMYLFNNTYIVKRSSDIIYNEDEKMMYTSCVIIYEDSLKRVLDMVRNEE